MRFTTEKPMFVRDETRPMFVVIENVSLLKRLQMAVERFIYDYRRNRCAKGTTEGDVAED